MNRREFLTRSWQNANSEASEQNWIRPPFAARETEFRQTCTSCGDCADACPHGVIFGLDESAGEAAGSPALDLLHKGCHLCPDWPCVAACETGALALPAHGKDGEDAAPWPEKLAVMDVDADACIAYLGPECGACAQGCPVDGALVWHDRTRPAIDGDRCIGCGLCREACIVLPKAIRVRVAGGTPADG